MNPRPSLRHRRLILRAVGMLGAQTFLSSCGGKETTGSARDDVSSPDLRGCTLTPPQIEGPYYLPLNRPQVEMTSGQLGTRLDLHLTIVNSSCEPINDARVEVWHANAHGIYSGFAGQAEDTRGQDFLRGEALSDARGQVRLRSLYPGWYPGRAVHVHFKVSVDQSLRLTSQFYLPDEVSLEVYRGGLYQARGAQDTSLSRDHFLQELGGDHASLIAEVTPDQTGYIASLKITV